MKKLFCITVLALLPSYAFAEDKAPPPQAQARPCREDVKKFCGDVKPGGGAVMECLKAHEKELSSECKAQAQAWKEKRKERREDMRGKMKDRMQGSEGHEGLRERMRDKMQALMAACKGDMEKVCADVKPGGGAKIRCLKENESKLSPACREALPKGRPGANGSAPMT